MDPTPSKRIKIDSIGEGNRFSSGIPDLNTSRTPSIPSTSAIDSNQEISWSSFPFDLVKVVFGYLSPLSELPRIALTSSYFKRLLSPPFGDNVGFGDLYQEFDFTDRPSMEGSLILKIASVSPSSLLRLDHLSITTSDAALGAGLPHGFQAPNMISLVVHKQAWAITGNRLLPMRLLSAFPNLRLLDTDGFDATNWDRVAQLCPKIEYISTGTVSVDTESLRSALKVWKPRGLKMPWFSYEYEKMGDEITTLPLNVLLLPRYQITHPEFLTKMTNLTTVKIIYNSWVAAPMRLSLSLPHLVHLDMSGCADEVYLVAKCPKLKFASLNRCRFRHILLESDQLAFVDLSCAEMTADLFDHFLASGAHSVSTVDLRGFYFISESGELPPDCEVTVRDILDGRSAHQTELCNARMSGCELEALQRLCACSGTTISDLYVPLSVLNNQRFQQIVESCPKLDRLLINDFTDTKVASLQDNGGIDALKNGRFPPDAMPVSQRFLEILSNQSEQAFIHIYCGYQSNLAAPLNSESTSLANLSSLEFVECDLTRPHQISQAMTALPSLQQVKLQACNILGSTQQLKLSGARLQSISLSQVSFSGLDLTSAPALSKLEVYHCQISTTTGSPILAFAPEILGEQSSLRYLSLRRFDYSASISSADRQTMQNSTLSTVSKLPNLSTLRLDHSAIAADSSSIGEISLMMTRPSLLLVGIPASLLQPPTLFATITKQCFQSPNASSQSSVSSVVRDIELDAFGIHQLDATKLISLVEELITVTQEEKINLPPLFITGFVDPDARTELRMSAIQRKSNGSVKFDIDGAHALQFQLDFEQSRGLSEVHNPIGKFMTDRFDRCFISN